MHVSQLPSGRWRVTIRANGNRYTQTFDYEYEAEAWGLEAPSRLAAVMATLTPAEAASSPARACPTVAAHGLEWVERRGARLASATVKNYHHHLRYLVEEGIGLERLDALRKSDVERWQTRRKEAGVGVATLNARLKLLRSIYLDAMAERVIDFNPTHGVDLLTGDQEPHRWLTDLEEHALLAALPADQHLPVLLGLDAGLRWSEVFGVPARAVLGDYVSVWQVVERETRKLRSYPKGHRARVVPLTDRLVDPLAALAEARLEADGPDALLFVTEAGSQVDYFNYRHRVWRPTMVASKLRAPRPGFHSLRHTYGTRLAAAGVPRKEIAVLMGHADEKTTAGYVHEAEDGRRRDLVRAALGQGTARRLRAV